MYFEKKLTKATLVAVILSFPLSWITMNFIKNLLKEKTLFGSVFSLPKTNLDFKLLLSLEALFFILAIFFLLYSEKKYLAYDEYNIEVMKGIVIPKPIQNKFQYGSSWFLEEKNFDKVFAYNILEENEMVKKLLRNEKIPEEMFKKYKFEKGGISLGLQKNSLSEKIYFNDDDTHSIILGATRSGKGRTVLLQTIGVQGMAGENMILSDPKGELYCYTKPFLENLGYEVVALDFEEPEKSNSYNFLQNIIDYVNENDISRAMDSVEDVVDMLVSKGSSEPIWENGEKSILSFAILLVVIENKDKPQYQNLTNVYYFLSNLCVEQNGKTPLNNFIKNLPDDHPAKMKASISLVAPEKTRGSFFTSALSTLRLFSNPFIYEMSKQTDFDINNTEKKRAIFIILPDQKETYNSLAGLFISQYYNSLIKSAKANGNRLERRVNFNLDEYGNYPPITGMESKMTVSAGYGIRFNLFIQSFAQLVKVYDEETARTLKDNAETLIYLKSTDSSTQEEISKRLGSYTAINVSESNSKSGVSSSTSYIERPLLMPAEVKQIERPNTLVIKSGNNCIFQSPDLSQWKFNELFGLGDKEHNQRVIAERQGERNRKDGSEIKMEIWKDYSDDLQDLEYALPSLEKTLNEMVDEIEK